MTHPLAAVADALEVLRGQWHFAGSDLPKELFKHISTIRAAAGREAARDALLLTVAKIFVRDFVAQKEAVGVLDQIAAVEALAAPHETMTPAGGMTLDEANKALDPAAINRPGVPLLKDAPAPADDACLRAKIEYVEGERDGHWEAVVALTARINELSPDVETAQLRAAFAKLRERHSTMTIQWGTTYVTPVEGTNYG